MAQVPRIHLQTHPPERRKTYRSTVCNGCSCCCCCCVHSLGGVIGTVVGWQKAVKDENISDKETVSRIVRTYWSLVGLLTFFLISRFLLDTKWESALMEVLFFLPVIQLFASIVAYIGIAIWMSDSKRTAAFKTMNKITLWTIVGAIIGILLMLIIAVVLSAI